MTNRWGNNGNSDILYLGGSQITADGDCSHEIKRHLLLGRKAMTNLDTILKSRDIILLTKVHLVKAMVFPVVTHGCDSWTIKKAEHWRMDAFELWCWRRLLRVPWTERRSNQSTLKETKPEYSLEGLMLNLKWRTDSFEKTLMLEEKGTAEDEMVVWHHRLDGHEFEQVLGVGDGQGSLVCCSPWGHKEKDTSEWLNWTVLLGDTLMKRLWSSVKGGPSESLPHWGLCPWQIWARSSSSCQAGTAGARVHPARTRWHWAVGWRAAGTGQQTAGARHWSQTWTQVENMGQVGKWCGENAAA